MFSIRSIKKYLLSHDNYLTRLIPWLFTFLGGNKIKIEEITVFVLVVTT